MLFSRLLKPNIRPIALNRQYGSSSKALDQFKSILNTQLSEIKEAGTYKSERVITSAQKTEISVAGSKNTVLNFCANNYLGLAVKGSCKNFQIKLMVIFSSTMKR